MQEYEHLKAVVTGMKEQIIEIEQERDQLQLQVISNKQNFETLLRNIREQITEKEQKYCHLFKELQTNISELQRKNNEMIKINSELIKKVCCVENNEGVITNSTATVRRLEWFIST